MKVIISILLSVALLAAEAPVMGQGQLLDSPGRDVIEKQESDEEQESDEKQEGSEGKHKERVRREKLTKKSDEGAGILNAQKEIAKDKGGVTKEGEIAAKKDKAPDKLEAALEEGGAASPSVQVEVDDQESSLVLESGELVSVMEETGYHYVRNRIIECRHTASTINASVKCKRAANPLNPTRNELVSNIRLTGKLRNKEFSAHVKADDKGGVDNTVTHLRLEVEVDAPGVGRELLAGPYVCGDGYAAYAYFEKHYSYCPNAKRFCKAGESHVWLGCKGGDNGTVEFHPARFSHTFMTYKKSPNKYKVKYHANGGGGTISSQDAVYGQKLTLSSGSRFKRDGYTLTGWNTRADGRGTQWELGEKVKNLTSENDGQVTLYAQWRVNTLTVRYNANGGTVDWVNAPNKIEDFTNRWNYKTAKSDPADFYSFRLSRIGYARNVGGEWNTQPDGTGSSFDQGVDYEMTAYAPNLKDGDQEIVLYAQWKPNVYTITLQNGLADPHAEGTGRLYKKYGRGIFFDSAGSREFASGQPISIPGKTGYVFRGYYALGVDNADASGNENSTQLIDKSGQLTAKGLERQGVIGNETWYARYGYLIGCEDYADIPCDLERADGDGREDLGVSLFYDSITRKVTVETAQPGCDISLIVQPPGTEIGNFKSSLGAGSVSGSTKSSKNVQMPLTVPEGAAYRLKVMEGQKSLCDKYVYMEDGRFRTLAKMGEKEAMLADAGDSLAGSAWGTHGAEYGLYRYDSCSEIKNIQGPGNVQRYFRYKDVNMAYSGNGANFGKNTLERHVPLEDMYRFRENGFAKEGVEKKYTKGGKEYECKVKYSFQGWEMIGECLFAQKAQHKMMDIYLQADEKGVISNTTKEDIHTYQEADMVYKLPGIGRMAFSGVGGNQGAGQGNAAASAYAGSEEYINLCARWDSCPTIVVAPGERMEFYEGEEVSKEKLVSRLLAHDNEDNKDMGKYPDLNDKLRIVKVSYPEPGNHSQAAYEETYEKDVPAGFLLDTYYLKLEKDEVVEALVTFAVTDSTGNTTTEQVPVRVKYNNYPQISSEDTYYYLKEEANQGGITTEALIGRAAAGDKEDGDITGKLKLKDFDAQEIKMQTQAKAEFDVTYQVTDSYKKTSYKTVKLVVWDEDAAIAQMPQRYVRFISKKYLGTLEENSIWREPGNLAYLKNILGNEAPLETWEFTHEDVLAIQEWMTGSGDGSWKLGQEANQEFLAKFSHCRQ